MSAVRRVADLAVFAAFSFCIRDDLLSNPEFKPVGVDQELDIWRYGRQKRQDRGKKRQETARMWQRGIATLARMALAEIGFRTSRYVIVQVLPPIWEDGTFAPMASIASGVCDGKDADGTRLLHSFQWM